MLTHPPGRRHGLVLAATALLTALLLASCSLSPDSDRTPSPPAPDGSTPSSTSSSSSVSAVPTAEPSDPAPGSAAPSATGPAVSASPSPGASGSPAKPAEPVTQRKPGWALDRIDQRGRTLNSRYTVTSQGKGVTVYVVDGLFDAKNAEFAGRASVGLKRGRGCGLEDGIDHGLFVAGIIAGRKTGVAKQARLVSVGALNGCEGGTGGESEAEQRARIVRALNWVAKNGRRPAVVNLSLNMPAPAPTLEKAVRRVVAGGFSVVASAGNNGKDACRYPPAGLPGVITVAAATRGDRDAGLNHGRCVDLFAPAEGITSVVDPSLDPDRIVTSDGAATSWAAPFVSGAAALYLSSHPDAAPAQTRSWLIDHASTGKLRGGLHGSPNRLLYVGGL